MQITALIHRDVLWITILKIPVLLLISSITTTISFCKYHQLTINFPFILYVLISIIIIHSATSLQGLSAALVYTATPVFPGM